MSNAHTTAATKVLALGRFLQPPTPEQRQEIMPREVPDTLRLILSGQIEQFWARTDGTGPVFLLNVPTAEAARDLLEKLPLGVAKLMDFDLIPLGPLAPLGLLIGEWPPTWGKSPASLLKGEENH